MSRYGVSLCNFIEISLDISQGLIWGYCFVGRQFYLGILFCGGDSD